MIMRTEKNKNYTVMGNYHLRDKELSLKAKGLLSIMLSLPDGWNFSTQGLTTLSSDGETAIRSTLKELEQKGYLKRNKVRINGKIADWEYVVYEQKQPVSSVDSESHVENVHVDSIRQLNTKELNTKEINKDISLEAPIPAESERTDNKMKSVENESSPYLPNGASQQSSAAGIAKKKPLVKKISKPSSIDKAAVLGKLYALAYKIQIEPVLEVNRGEYVVTIGDAFDFWTENATYREGARDAYGDKFLEAWQRIFVYHESDFYKRVRGADGHTHYMWENVVAKYAENWNKGTPAERRENEARDALGSE